MGNVNDEIKENRNKRIKTILISDGFFELRQRKIKAKNLSNQMKKEGSSGKILVKVSSISV